MIYIVITNSHSWGKGQSRREALFNALSRANKKPTKFQLVECSKNTVHVDQMGRVIASMDAEVEDLGLHDLPAEVWTSYQEFDTEACEMFFQIDEKELEQ